MSQVDNDQVTNDDIADIAGQLELEAEVETPETPVETDKPAPAKEEPEAPETPEGDTPPEGEKPEGEDTPDAPAAEEKKPEDTPDEEAARKERNRQFYEARQQERQTQQRQIEHKINEAYQPQTVDELTQSYIDQGYDEFQASMLARDERREQQSQINEGRAQVAELNMQIETEAVQVMHEYPVFDPKSEKYDKAFADKASELYNKAANVVTDPKTGFVVKTNLTPYEFYKELAEMRGSGVSQAQVAAQAAAQAQMAAVAPTTSTVPVVHENTEDKQAAALEAALGAVR